MASKEEKIDLILRPFRYDNDSLNDIMGRLHKEMEKGLKKETNPEATVKMLATYVRAVPDGTESGDFLALDLGGSNFRVLHVHIEKGAKDVRLQSDSYAIPESIMTGSGEQLFDYIADCMGKFLEKIEMKDKKMALGFTFSFPCKQQGLDCASLIKWTKGFSAAGVEGEDVVRLLRDAIKRRGDFDTDVVAVVNDTVGTMMACGLADHDCLIGLIVGTGSNACYMEKLDNVEIWEGDRGEPNQVVVNMEWGAFGEDGALDDLRTAYDREIDEHSINKGQQIYEKMISGMYMGELVRLVLLEMTKQMLVFGGRTSPDLETRGTFLTKYVSEIEECTYLREPIGDMGPTMKILHSLGLKHATETDCGTVREVCRAVSTRAAHLVSAGISAIVNKMGRERVAVGVDGSVYKYHPHFKELMTQTIDKLTHSDVKLMLSEDGSGKGAALVTAVACRLAGNS
ncbi:hexokinase-4-like isoform X1 [Branchiostoma lanceolatum]|uniref:hexokinase-4-like isoform X1 n=1 Tax=Branchiostoma lanceolatum TaxID=7740 RepID=UPI003453D53B